MRLLGLMLTVLEIIEIIGGFVGIFAIIIVIWDHFKDDRKLTKQVQDYYESIELFLARNIQVTQIGSDNKQLYIKYLSEFEYYKNIMENNFSDFSKYLGLILGKSRDSRYKDNKAYITKTGYVLVDKGQLLFRDPEMLGTYERHAIGNATYLKKSEIIVIDAFLTDLRMYWKSHYQKTFFRPKLKKILDISDFVVVDDLVPGYSTH